MVDRKVSIHLAWESEEQGTLYKQIRIIPRETMTIITYKFCSSKLSLP